MGAVPLELPDSWSYGLLRGSATAEYDGALDRRSSFAVMRSSARYGFYSADRPLRLAIYRRNMRTARRSGDLVTLVLALYAIVSISFYLVSVRYFDIGDVQVTSGSGSRRASEPGPPQVRRSAHRSGGRRTVRAVRCRCRRVEEKGFGHRSLEGLGVHCYQVGRG